MKRLQWLSAVLILVICAGCTSQPTPADPPSQMQIEHLGKLCKVWGYVKYYHPVFAEKNANCDTFLTDIIPEVLDAPDSVAVNAVLSDWVSSLGDIDDDAYPHEPSEELQPYPVSLEPDTGWIQDTAYLGDELSGLLLRLDALHLRDRSYYPTRTAMTPFAFPDEDALKRAKLSDPNMRLLGLFRLFNMLQYYYPYRELTTVDLDEALPGLIGEMLAGSSRRSYELTLLKLAALTGDGHVSWGGDALVKDFGKYNAPVRFILLDGQVIITEVSSIDCTLLPGDILLQMDGEDMGDRLQRIGQYIPLPTESKVTPQLRENLLRTKRWNMEFTVLRNGAEETATAQLNMAGGYVGAAAPHAPYEDLGDGIGRINPQFLKAEEIPSILDKVLETKAVIIDLRQYPSMASLELFQHFSEEPMDTFMGTIANVERPGQFLMFENPPWEVMPPVYEGNIVVLTDENTISFGETCTMMFQNLSGVTVIGAPTMGANGDVMIMVMPGNFTLTASGIGVCTMEGGQTQRIGLEPDITVTPTMEDLRQNRDHILDAALEYLKNEN